MILAPKVIFQDDWLLAIDKPFGWVSLYGSGKLSQLQEWLIKEKKVSLDKTTSAHFRKRTGIAHRLDKETSGILLIGRNERTFLFLQEHFRKRKILKQYLALVRGEAPQEGEIKAPIRRRQQRQSFVVAPQGKLALTQFTRQALYQKEKEKFSLLRATMKTGRSHQIRVHFQYLGFPLWGDSLYGGKKAKEEGRLFLHANGIRFFHPWTEKAISLDSQLPNQLKTILSTLEEIDEEKENSRR